MKAEPIVTSFNDASLLESAEQYLKKVFFEITKTPVNMIDSETPLEKYGVDSVMILNINNRLKKDFDKLRKTLLFEHRTLKSLAGYLIKDRRVDLEKVLGWQTQVPTNISIKTIAMTSEKTNLKYHKIFKTFKSEKHNILNSKYMDIAIIGVSGRYPKADDLNQLWDNLAEGKDCIEEIPLERWDYNLYYDEKRSVPGKTHSKWGGFINNADKFDPLFFNISPREAEQIDPQERLMLEIAWGSIEDAGYNPLNLQYLTKGKVGVFVGVMWNEYQLLRTENSGNEDLFGNSNTASLANRISYILNIHGPSLVIDTACSSSLVAIHMACEYLQMKECKYAIAGGVNLSLHPSKYVNMSLVGLLSTDGRCRSFGEGGDGYVPGEGVGAILLKPLADAVRDNDNIYAVIKGTSTNHGGKTNGFTVPNPDSQAELVKEALEKSNTDPASFSYMEAHGTGTSLGDPIEITGLTKAFGENIKSQSCPIGSVKSNMGHLEGAAGIIGVTKILLQMKNKKLVPSLHSKTLNSYIDFDQTPFYVQHKLEDWSSHSEHPRRAGISSFGAMGTNAHAILEEYITTNSIDTPINYPLLIILSAKNSDRLKEYANNLLEFIKINQEVNLADLSYTLQIGRDGMDERLGIIIESREGLETKLKDYIDGKENIDNVYTGQVKKNKEILAAFGTDEAMQALLQTWINEGKYHKLLDLWVKGLNFDWNKLYGNNKPKKISAPTYPFAKERYWVEVNTDSNQLSKIGSKSFLYPLLQENISTLSEQKFKSTFTGEEFFLKDHVVNGRKILPGVAYLEMATEAIYEALDNVDEKKQSIKFKNIIWAQSIVVDKTTEVSISLFPKENSDISFEITTENGSDAIVNSQCVASIVPISIDSKINLKELKANLTEEPVSIQEIYASFDELGIHYGKTFRALDKVFVNKEKNEILAYIKLPESISSDFNEYKLHPSILDAAIGVGIVFRMLGSDKKSSPLLPFALDEMICRKPIAQNMWAWVKINQDISTETLQKIDIDLYDDEGNVCVQMKGFTARALKTLDDSNVTNTTGTLIFEPYLKEKDIATDASSVKEILKNYNEHYVFIAGFNKKHAKNFEKSLKKYKSIKSIIYYNNESANISEQFKLIASQLFNKIKLILESKPQAKVLIQVVIPYSYENQIFMSLSGLLKTTNLENPRIITQIISTPLSRSITDSINIVIENTRCLDDHEVLYINDNKRFVKDLKEKTIVDKKKDITNLPWKDNGIYLITGGLGGLGQIFSTEIAKNCSKTIIILTGRAILNNSIKDKLKNLKYHDA
ncbi:polyketide synthase dehydratase domain-containing protein, partial [Gammaproteobacteria bacterium]|nr:polyketide synthase dehydratase domain-containing protein [Gammaproteobacteria bacterium]